MATETYISVKVEEGSLRIARLTVGSDAPVGDLFVLDVPDEAIVVLATGEVSMTLVPATP